LSKNALFGILLVWLHINTLVMAGKSFDISHECHSRGFIFGSLLKLLSFADQIICFAYLSFTNQSTS